MARRQRRPGFGEGFQSTFQPTAQDVFMTTLKQLLSQPEREQEARLREAQISKLDKESKPQIDNTHVTLTPEIIEQLPQLKGLDLIGKSVPATQMLDIRRYGKGGQTPQDELNDLSRLINTPEIQFGAPGVREALMPRFFELVKTVHRVDAAPKKVKAGPAKSKDEVAAKFGFGKKK